VVSPAGPSVFGWLVEFGAVIDLLKAWLSVAENSLDNVGEDAHVTHGRGDGAADVVNVVPAARTTGQGLVQALLAQDAARPGGGEDQILVLDLLGL